MSYRFFHTPATARSINSLFTEELFKPILYALYYFFENFELVGESTWPFVFTTIVVGKLEIRLGSRAFFTPEKTLSASKTLK